MRSSQPFVRLAVAVLGACAMSVQAAGPPQARWLADRNGCKVANPHAQPLESLHWSGECKDGFAHGAGVVRWFAEGKPNGITSGRFQQGKLMGRGHVILPHAVHSQVKISGRFVERRRFWPEGTRLDGDFFENELVGHGTLTKPNGEKTVVRQTDGRLVRI